MLKQLAGQTAIYGLGTIVPRFLNYLLFPYLTRVMTVGEYGVVTDLYALIPFVLVLLTMGLETGYFRFAGKAGSEAEKRTIFSNVWGAVTAVSIVFFVLALLFTSQLARVMEYTDHSSYIRLVAAIVMLNTVTAIPLARLRQQGPGQTVHDPAAAVRDRQPRADFLFLLGTARTGRTRHLLIVVRPAVRSRIRAAGRPAGQHRAAVRTDTGLPGRHAAHPVAAVADRFWRTRSRCWSAASPAYRTSSSTGR